MMKMLFAVVALVPLLLGQGGAQILPCAAGCVSGVFANAANMGCAMNDILCVCGKSTDFSDGIRDCVNQACPAADVAAQLPLAQSAGTDQCKTASAAAATPTTSTPAQSQVTPLTQQAAASPSSTATETPAETTETTATPISTTSPVSTPTAQTTEAALSVASTDSGATSTTSAADQSSTDSASTAMSSTTDSGAASGATAAADSSGSGSPSTSSDLSVAARAGIGAGSGVAAVLLGIIAFCLLTRRRKQKRAAQQKSMQILQPLPGSGRLYANNMRQADASLSKTFTQSPLSKKSNQPAARAPSPTTPPYSPSVASSYDPDLDLNARRYEDLTPRTQPRTMI
ncbi:uncharacterized protein GGS22DRAFT_81950 [Annulohypoxylon maeteangense]|uniref:uncharacterized protein n=1 Tax=Annulohypoxylon maeteangense TaxID=1927788 RepID=UPI002008C3AF|nr:uncharacterized protein GGS22DRAFT_81950 [Annulohypoxylon maeteangense]KAI0880684.1 hypothetical protein GGS22DRAFT_81950 [Annulohypoxylon maeteangense]